MTLLKHRSFNRAQAGRDFSRVIPQSRPDSCGLAALATLMNEVLHLPTSEAALQARLKHRRPASLTDLSKLSRQAGLKAHAYAVDLDLLLRVQRPAILHMGASRRIGHYVVVRGVADDKAWLADPMRGNVHLDLTALKKHWYVPRKPFGHVLYVAGADEEWLPLNEEHLPGSPPETVSDWFPPPAGR
ncbi:C39 family peptidase [Alkalilimnicola ehrlichii MLHE-1]|uniref:Peptidase C39, bacteriocin processing n=1 Tax=Alkalilimnicola ehrlichii (strain ATCC BAA-1101 / DSM 17681 / MLHE-1) TaxID=187272 RepID=Q0A6P5_ALKEH|nr:cysteine peptidase family C39 domain-containing protein [Alkalilimnicola ehrlichii]ABI57492.1 peptidase C39, bacteriocin processing [Alkalilimnicola ehrlichii MLHE-1]